MTSLSGKDTSFKWPRTGIFQGTVVVSSDVSQQLLQLVIAMINVASICNKTPGFLFIEIIDSKKEMEIKANKMATGEKS